MSPLKAAKTPRSYPFVPHLCCVPSIVTRGCGKHMAVQSNDTPPGRPCEQCAAEALNGGVKHSPPYIWNNSNYLLKMTEDLDFLGNVDPLLGFLGEGFELKGNPFLLAPPASANCSKVKKHVGRGRSRQKKRGELAVCRVTPTIQRKQTVLGRMARGGS